jgi:hypothetical protein
MKNLFETWLLTYYENLIDFYQLPLYFQHLIKIGWINTHTNQYIRIDQGISNEEWLNGEVCVDKEIIKFTATTPEALAAGAISRFEELYDAYLKALKKEEEEEEEEASQLEQNLKTETV